MAVPTYTREQLLTLISTKLAGSPTTIHATEHRDLEIAIVNAIYGQVGDIKEIACDQNYINNNFDMTALAPGLGLANGERYGWAICNGNNGTINKMGRVGVGYDPTNYAIGTTGGEKTHTLLVTEMPPHTHKISGSTYDNGDPGNYALGSAGTEQDFDIPTKITGGAGSTSTGNTSGGATVPHNNMQPYIVTLFIQRIPMP